MNEKTRIEAGSRIIQYLKDVVKGALAEFNASPIGSKDQVDALEMFKDYISILEDHKYVYDLDDDGKIECFPLKPRFDLTTTPILREDQKHPRRK